MTEELVTLETAKMLKEKGFNEYCKDIINHKGIMMETIFRTSKDLPKLFYSCPTQSVAQKWLRETKGSRNMIYTQEQNTLIWQSSEQTRVNTIDNL